MSKKDKKTKIARAGSERGPGYDDAQLVMELYDLRREEVLRHNRDRIAREFWPSSYDEFVAVTQFAHDLNTALRQVATYWEMVYGTAYHGIIHAEYLVENSGEGLLLYAKCEPFVERYRDEFAPRAFRHAEWAATRTETGRQLMDVFRERLPLMREQVIQR